MEYQVFRPDSVYGFHASADYAHSPIVKTAED